MRSAAVGRPLGARVVIVGGGIAGAWLAYRLARKDVDVLLIADDDAARPVSRRWAAAVIQRRTVEEATASGAFDDVTTTRPPGFDRIVDAHLAGEFAEFERLVPVMGHGDLLIPRHGMPRPRLGAGDAVVAAVLRRFALLGGRVLAGTVTDLVVSDGRCRGVRLVTQGTWATALAGDVVIASGGVSGLFGDGGTGGTGLLLGTCARAGVALDNLEMFHRFALGDLTHGRPLYPFDLHGARLLRDGRPATELTDLLRTTPPQRVDLAAWRSYWVRHQGVPHTAELATGTVRLGPIRGFSAGGVPFAAEDRGLRGLHATGEAGHSLVADSVLGLPWASYLALGGELSRRLAEAPAPDFGDSGPVGRTAPSDPALHAEVARRLQHCHDRFTTGTADELVRWCRTRRRRRSGADADLLILAESCVSAALARTDSRGFFHRADHPEPDQSLDHRWTRTRYDADADEVRAELVEVTGPATREAVPA